MPMAGLDAQLGDVPVLERVRQLELSPAREA
jgi:hypothetical protein